MHDCLNLQEKLFDLAMGELSTAEQTLVLADVARCALCRAELDSLEKTLSLYDQAAALRDPAAAEWRAFEQDLRGKFAPQEKARTPFWRRFFSASISVPAPVLAATVLSFGVTAFFALREPKQIASPNLVETAQTPIQVLAPKPVQMPEQIVVEKERVVTRRIYVTRRGTAAAAAAASPKQAKPNAVPNQIEMDSSPLNLAEFKPVSPVSPTTVKENKPK